ncbi:MAG: Ig-like domain-containing protein, partial [bacterium]
MKIKDRKKLFFWSLLVIFLSGCGIRLFKGSDDASPPPPLATGGISVRIIWPQKEKERLIPSATNSVKVRIIKGEDVLLEDVIKREAGQTEVKRRYEKIPVGDVIFEASAYASTDGKGVALAKGRTTVQIVVNQYMPVSITMESTIEKVEVSPNPVTIQVGKEVQLTATAKDAEGNIVMVPSGGFDWSSSNTAVATVDSNGLV